MAQEQTIEFLPNQPGQTTATLQSLPINPQTLNTQQAIPPPPAKKRDAVQDLRQDVQGEMTAVQRQLAMHTAKLMGLSSESKRAGNDIDFTATQAANAERWARQALDELKGSMGKWGITVRYVEGTGLVISGYDPSKEEFGLTWLSTSKVRIYSGYLTMLGNADIAVAQTDITLSSSSTQWIFVKHILGSVTATIATDQNRPDMTSASVMYRPLYYFTEAGGNYTLAKDCRPSIVFANVARATGAGAAY